MTTQITSNTKLYTESSFFDKKSKSFGPSNSPRRLRVAGARSYVCSSKPIAATLYVALQRRPSSPRNKRINSLPADVRTDGETTRNSFFTDGCDDQLQRDTAHKITNGWNSEDLSPGRKKQNFVDHRSQSLNLKIQTHTK